MFSSSLRTALLSLSLVLVACGPKSGLAGPGTPLTIQVKDESGNPVTTAAIRNPDEAERHKVNSVNGTWSASSLFLEGGAEVPFTTGQEVTFEISAPGYLSETVRYLMRKRKNLIVVTLSEMDIKGDLDKIEDPLIMFGRDKPLDGQAPQ